jgi:hypothetical protein
MCTSTARLAVASDPVDTMSSRVDPTDHRGRQYWTPEEDAILRSAIVHRCGRGQWTRVSLGPMASRRTSKQCRERWLNHLAPTLARLHPWSSMEDVGIVYLRVTLGCEWADVRTAVPWRSKDDIRKRFNKLDKSEATLEPLDPVSYLDRFESAVACLALAAPDGMNLDNTGFDHYEPGPGGLRRGTPEDRVSEHRVLKACAVEPLKTEFRKVACATGSEGPAPWNH